MIAVGVDTHKHQHLAVAVDLLGQLLAEITITATLAGYRELLAWIGELEGESRVGIEGAGSYGAGLCEYLQGEGITVFEVERPRRRERRTGKSDRIDALLAAKKVLASDGLSTPRGHGKRVALQMLLVAYRSVISERSRLYNQLQALHVSAPATLRERIGPAKNGAKLARRLTGMRTRPNASLQENTTLQVLRDIANRTRTLDHQAQDYTRQIDALARELAPALLQEPGVGPICAVAAEYRHTTARGVLEGDVPDPQLHSHVVITSAIREDGQIVAVASRPIFRSARELGAYYRSSLAHQLQQRGYAIERGTGKHGRYFEIAGVPRSMLDAFSARSREVARAAERFRAQWGRAPERGELRALKLENRKAKMLVTRTDLQSAWNDTAARFDFTGDEPGRLLSAVAEHTPEGALEDRVEQRLTERAATFEPGEFRAVLLEQSVGEVSPHEALERSRAMIAERRVLPLEGGLMTTLTVRAREQAIERRFATLASTGGRDVGNVARTLASDQIAERIGGRLSPEQAHALQVITGPERAAVLVGPAGTGKGVVIDAAARAEQYGGHQTLGIAVSGSTAQRLGQDSPALAGRTLTLDALVSRVERGQLHIDADTTIYFDEAGMADTDRLDRLTETVEHSGSKLVAIGDAAQLPSIGAGGMFARLDEIAPSAELSNIRRTLDRDEQRAWSDLRAGRSDRAMAHYHARGQLHMADTRDEAVEHAAQNWAALTETHDPSEVALISDASNQEIHRLNARAQHFRAERGELGDLEVPVPGIHYGIRQGDRVAMIDQHHEPGVERIENGSRGEVLDITPAGEVLIEFDVTARQRTLAGDDLSRVRLGYAQHIHRAQGATVTRTLVVTGGWQTSKEPAYVEASRARQGTDWFVSRQDLGIEGHDTNRIQRLAENMQRSHAQTPSLAHPELADRDYGTHFHRSIAPSRTSRIPGIVRAINRIVNPPAQERTR